LSEHEYRSILSNRFECTTGPFLNIPLGHKPHVRLQITLILLIALVSALLYLPFLGSYRIIEPSDGFYTEAAREMLETGDFVLPHLNYQPFFDKPILIYWLVAAAYKIVGISTFAARLPSALSAVAMSVATFVFARAFLTTRTAISAAIILCSSSLLLVVGHVDLIDAPLSLMTELSAFSFFLVVETERRNLLWLAYACLGIGLLLKGPVILFLVGGTIVSYLLATRKIGDMLSALKMLKLTPGLVLTLAIAIPWYALAGIQSHGEFLTEFFLKQNILRALGKVKLNHAQPFYFYVPVIFVGTAPWSWLPLASVPFIRSLVAQRYSLGLAEKGAIFCVAWSAVVFLFFSAVTGKLGTYVLPLLPAVSILCAITLDRLAQPGNKLALNLGVLSNCVLLIAAFVYAWRYFQPNQLVGFGLIAALVSYVAAAIGCAALGKPGNEQKSLAVLLSLNLFGSAFLGPTLMFGFYNRRQLDYEQIVDEAAKYPGDLAQAVAPRASLGFYLRRKVECVDDTGPVVHFIHQSNRPHIIVVYDKFNSWIQSLPVHEELAHHGHWYLYRIEDPEDRLLHRYQTELRNLKSSQSAEHSMTTTTLTK
jgi:4-amino-4-deoxy-L-arabinose transferase-like glycosyltransferase